MVICVWYEPLLFVKSSLKYTLLYSSCILVESISCFPTDSVELSLNSRWTRASTTLINMQFLYVLGVRFLGKNINTSDWLNLFYAWIKALYLVNILLMTMCFVQIFMCFILSWKQFFICAKYISFPFSYCITCLYWYATCQKN